MEISNSKKRVRDGSDDSEVNSPESKRIRLDSHHDSKFVRVDSFDSVTDSPEVNLIRDDLLDILDDTDANPSIQELDSFIKSFEEEILHPPTAESQPDLGFLLGASDDELGLPPTFSTSGEGEDGRVEDFHFPSDVVVGLPEISRFEDEIPSYDSYGFGFVGEPEINHNQNAEFVTLGGLFDHSDDGSEPADYSEFLWRPESLPAV